jgi:hypothetical protein
MPSANGYNIFRDARELAALDVNQPAAFAKLSAEDRRLLVDWIRSRLRPSKVLSDYTSYGLKHLMEDETGVYVTNGEFKGGMAACGYEPLDASQVNWSYHLRFTRQGMRLIEEGA